MSRVLMYSGLMRNLTQGSFYSLYSFIHHLHVNEKERLLDWEKREKEGISSENSRQPLLTRVDSRPDIA